MNMAKYDRAHYVTAAFVAGLYGFPYLLDAIEKAGVDCAGTGHPPLSSYAEDYGAVFLC